MKTKSTKKDSGERKKTQKTPKKRKFMTMILSGFILCCAAKHDVTTKQKLYGITASGESEGVERHGRDPVCGHIRTSNGLLRTFSVR